METLLNLLKGVAPALATVVAGPMGGAAISMIASKLGVEDTVASVAKAIAGDPDAALKLAEIDLAQFRAEVADRDSARQREVGMAQAGAGKFMQAVVPSLAIGTVLLTFAFIAALLFLKIANEQQQLVIFALGFATNSAQQVLSYYFGSSKSSQDKTAAMAKVATK